VPVARGTRFDARSIVVVAATVLAVALLLGGMFIYIAGNSENVRLGDDQFADLLAERTAKKITADGPIQFPDVSGGGRVVNLSHVGTDPQTGWFVFDARSPGAAKECLLDWDRTRSVFVDRCDATSTYPVEGTGLRQYAVRVDARGRLVIDFNVDPQTTTTAVLPTTTKVPTTTTSTTK
jgi:hypothetical protein